MKTPRQPSSPARPLFVLLLALLLAWPGVVLAETGGNEDEDFDPFAGSVLHLGGAVEFAWSQASVQGTEADGVTSFTLDGEVGYFPVDGLKLQGIPFFTVSGQGDQTAVIVGAAAGLAYYYDLGPLALFGRTRGGLVFGTLKDEEERVVSGTNTTQGTGLSVQESALAFDSNLGADGDLTGFIYGAGLGAALPVGTNVIEVAVDYLATNMTLKTDGQSVDGEQAAIYVHLGYLMAF